MLAYRIVSYHQDPSNNKFQRVENSCNSKKWNFGCGKFIILLCENAQIFSVKLSGIVEVQTAHMAFHQMGVGSKYWHGFCAYNAWKKFRYLLF